ncbi:protein starmaker-like isoform X1 [Ptychodera flava]|uniref:protein starmaker-like isoform X1 n=1 Tax=Ptychodera flava TaxID=63121 RepID=UPI00396A0621
MTTWMELPVGNSKEIPFIAMYDAVELSEMERTAQDIKTCEEMDKIQENITVGNFGQQDCAVEETEYIGDLNQSAVRETLHDLSFTLTRNPKSWQDQSSGNAMLINTGGQLTVEEEMESTNTGDQSAVRQTSCDLLLTQSSKIYQEVSVDTVDMNNQLKLEWFQTNLKEATKTERTEELNEEAPRDTSHEDGNLEPTTYKTEDYESSEKLAKLPNTEADFEHANIELSTKESNLEMNHSECDSKSKAAITDMLDAAAETTEVPSTDTDGANSSDESYHPEVESDSDEDFLPEAKSKKKRSAKKLQHHRKRSCNLRIVGRHFKWRKNTACTRNGTRRKRKTRN